MEDKVQTSNTCHWGYELYMTTKDNNIFVNKYDLNSSIFRPSSEYRNLITLSSMISQEQSSHLGDPRGMFDTESLSMLLKITFSPANMLFVQLTGTRTTHASNVIGTKILSLHKPSGRNKHNLMSLKMSDEHLIEMIP